MYGRSAVDRRRSRRHHFVPQQYNWKSCDRLGTATVTSSSFRHTFSRHSEARIVVVLFVSAFVLSSLLLAAGVEEPQETDFENGSWSWHASDRYRQHREAIDDVSANNLSAHGIDIDTKSMHRFVTSSMRHRHSSSDLARKKISDLSSVGANKYTGRRSSSLTLPGERRRRHHHHLTSTPTIIVPDVSSQSATADADAERSLSPFSSTRRSAQQSHVLDGSGATGDPTTTTTIESNRRRQSVADRPVASTELSPRQPHSDGSDIARVGKDNDTSARRIYRSMPVSDNVEATGVTSQPVDLEEPDYCNTSRFNVSSYFNTSMLMNFRFCEHRFVYDSVDRRTAARCRFPVPAGRDDDESSSATETADDVYCSLQLERLREADCFAEQMFAAFSRALLFFDCQDRYSMAWDCSHCKDAYKNWVCSVKLPFYDGQNLLEPCSRYCYMVANRCPYFSPHSSQEYAGQPVYLIPDSCNFIERCVSHDNSSTNCIDNDDLFNEQLSPRICYQECGSQIVKFVINDNYDVTEASDFGVDSSDTCSPYVGSTLHNSTSGLSTEDATASFLPSISADGDVESTKASTSSSSSLGRRWQFSICWFSLLAAAVLLTPYVVRIRLPTLSPVIKINSPSAEWNPTATITAAVATTEWRNPSTSLSAANRRRAVNVR